MNNLNKEIHVCYNDKSGKQHNGLYLGDIKVSEFTERGYKIITWEED